MIHSTAIIHSGAQIGRAVTVGPYSVIGDGACIGDGTQIGAHAVIESRVIIGRANQIGHGVIIGSAPQSKGFAAESAGVSIGDENVIREFVTIHAATSTDTPTRIGSRNFLMANTHVAHDMILADDVIVANGTVFAGHVEVQSGAFVSGLVGVHQFVRIGRYAMIGGMSRIVKDILPFGLYEGNPVKLSGVNAVGLRRARFTKESIGSVREAYQKLFFSSKPFREVLRRIESDVLAKDPCVAELIAFIGGSKRGFVGRAPGAGFAPDAPEDSAVEE